MKYILFFFLILVLLVSGGYFLLFSAGGNDILRGYINQYISAKISKDTKVEIVAFRLTPSHIDANITVNDSLHANINGGIILMQKAFDLDYHLLSDHFKVQNHVLKEKIDLTGKIKGVLEHIYVNGSGKAINSHVHYVLEVDKNVVKNIKADVDKGSLQSVLLLAGQKPFADGNFDLHINMPELQTVNPKGDAKLVLRHGKVNSKLIHDLFNVTLPQNFTYQARISTKLQGKYATM